MVSAKEVDPLKQGLKPINLKGSTNEGTAKEVDPLKQGLKLLQCELKYYYHTC